MPTTPPSNAGRLGELVRRDGRIFSPHPQVSLYFPAAAIENARYRASRAIERGDGPALVVGAAGTGKSLLLQVLAAQYREKFDVVLLACARICTRRALLQAILFELGLPYHHRDEGHLRLGLLDHLLSAEQSVAGLLLLVDEAQTLTTTLLDELRVMTNLMRGGAPRVRLVMAGSLAIEESFAHPELESFSQRLSARCYLSPLSREEACQYVRAQVAAAGAQPDSIFTADALDALFEASDGVPRLLNQLCDRTLLLANSDNRPLIDRHAVQAAWADLQQLPMPWDASPAANRSTPEPPPLSIEFGSLDPAPEEPNEQNASGDESTRGDVRDEAVAVAPVDNEPPGPAGPPGFRAHAATDPADPFAEQFDHEEIVLDTFAAWDDMFQRTTPRVENRRDLSLTTLVQAAVEACPESDRTLPEAGYVGDQRGAAEESPIHPSTTCSGDALPARSSPVRPRLRLVEPPESGTAWCRPAVTMPLDDVPPRSEPACIRAVPDLPVLIIESESGVPADAGPPVRRLAYQHLFSRLRSG